MNRWQVCRQIDYLIAQRRWEDNSSYDPVLKAHVIANPQNANALLELNTPFALTRPLNSLADPDSEGEEPQLERSGIEVLLIQAVENDALGESAFIGANRSSVQVSEGRGVLEIESEIKQAVVLLNGIEGIEMSSVWSSVADIMTMSGRQVAAVALRWECWCTLARYYHPPTRLTATDQGSGSVDLTWRAAPTRYDTLGGSTPQYVLRRASGATAPASPTAGTDVTVTAGATSLTDSPGAGQFSYTLFAVYDETGGGSADRYSAADARAQVTVTVT